MSETKNKKVLYIFDAGDLDSRFLLAQKAKDDGFDVTLVLIGEIKKPIKALDDFSMYHIPAGVRTFRAPALLKIAKKIAEIIKKERPEIIHAVTLKYGFLMGLAAQSQKNTNKIITLAGLGYLFRGENLKAHVIRAFLSPLLKVALKERRTKLIFQNQDDLDLMVQMGYAERNNVHLIKSSGVYLDRFSAPHISENKVEKNNNTIHPVVLMPTRLVHEKGIRVFIEAARILKSKNIDADFQIAGGLTQHNPRAIKREEMIAMTEDGVVEWLGHVDDLSARLSDAAIVVYPSYYGEGVPRVLLEACAAGCPIITTDHAGCRETVDEGVNGLLVPIKDAKATADAIEKLLSDPKLRQSMSAASRKKAQSEFDIHKISEQTLEIYKTA